MQKMLEGAGAKDVKIDFDAKTATCSVPASMDTAKLSGAVTGKFTAKVQQ